MGKTTKKIIVKNSIFLILLFLISIQSLSLILFDREGFLTREYEKKYENLKKFYYSSQYVQKENPAIMQDHHLESFAGGIFLKGLNPILIVHDQPPLGRYFISLSIFLFDNARTIILPLLLASAIGIFLISNKIYENAFIALIPVGIFVNEPIFLSKLYYSPLLETIQLPFIIFALYFFIKSIYSKNYFKWFIATAIMIGFVISIRFFVLGAVLTFAMFLFLLFDKNNWNKIIVFCVSMSLSFVVLILSYTRTIQLGYSILDIFGIQKYILVYHKSKFILPFSFWDLLLFNRWHTWWGDRSISFDSQWIILWPISTTLFFLHMCIGLIKKIKLKKEEWVLFLWVLGYTAILSAGYTSTRYFLPILPFLYILSVSFIYKAILIFRKK